MAYARRIFRASLSDSYVILLHRLCGASAFKDSDTAKETLASWDDSLAEGSTESAPAVLGGEIGID